MSKDDPDKKSQNNWFRASENDSNKTGSPSGPWFSKSKDNPDKKESGGASWFRGSQLARGQLISETSDVAPPEGEGVAGRGRNEVVRLDSQNTEHNRAAVDIVTLSSDNVHADRLLNPLLEASPLRQVDLSVADSFRLAEQFIRDGRVGRCIRVHLQDSQTRKIELIADSDTVKTIVQATGMFATLFHIMVDENNNWCHAVAFITSLVFFLFTGLKVATFGTYYLRGKPWQRAEVCVVVIHFVVVLIKFAQHTAGSKINAGWYQLLLPVIMLCWSRTMRHTLSVVKRTFIASLPSILFMLVILLMYGYYGFILFEDTFKDAYDGAVKEDNYANLFYSFVSTFILLTTENYPTIEVTAYAKHQAALFYFMPFIFITVILQALVLAKVDDTFTQALLQQTRYHFSKELRGYAFAFMAITLPEQASREKLLKRSRGSEDEESSEDVECEEPSISPEQWLKLVRYFQSSESEAKSFAEVTFFFRDDDSSGGIDLLEFLGLAELLKYEITREVDTLKSTSVSRPGWAPLRGLPDSALFVSCSTINIIVGSILMLSPSFQSKNGDVGEVVGRMSDSGMNALSGVLLSLFFVEIIFRMLSHGVKHHFHGFFDVFEALLLCFSITLSFSYGWRGASLIVLRLFCLLRWSMWRPTGSILHHVDRCVLWCTGGSLRNAVYGLMVLLRNSARRTISLFCYTGALLFFIQYGFSVIATMIIHHKLDNINQNPNAPLYGEYGEMTNFRTLGGSMIAMFQIMMTNNWNDIVYTSMEGTEPIIALFFILYYVLVPLVFLNIFTSIVLQSFRMDSNSETQAPGPIVVEMGGKYYRLERKSYRRGLELHMDLVENTKKELMQDIINGGVFATTVMSGVEEQLLEESQAFRVLQLRHQKQKELEQHEDEFTRAARNSTWMTPRSLVQNAAKAQRAKRNERRGRADTVARSRGVRTQFGHRDDHYVQGADAENYRSFKERDSSTNLFHTSDEDLCVSPTFQTASFRTRSDTAARDKGVRTQSGHLDNTSLLGGIAMDEMELQELRVEHENLLEDNSGTRDSHDLKMLRRVFAGPARVHSSVLKNRMGRPRRKSSGDADALAVEFKNSN